MRPAVITASGITNVLLLRLSKDKTDSESIEVQRANAQAFVKQKAWEGGTIELVAEGESGAEIHRRSDLRELLRLAEERRGRIRVVMRNQDRLARDAMWTSWLLCELSSRGVPEGALWTYDDGRQIETRGPGYALTALAGVRAESEWESNSKRRREALAFRARDGRATRAAPWGYRTEIDAQRHKRWVVDERMAGTVVLVAQTFVDMGGSMRGTAGRLNSQGVAAPGDLKKDGTRSQTRGWTARSVASVLRCPLYRGQQIFGATRTARVGGSVKSVAAPEEEVLRIARPELRIWSEDLLARIDELLSRVQPGTHRHGSRAAHLGSSFLRCGLCGSAVSVYGGNYACTAAVGSKGTACVGCGFKSERKIDAALLAAVAPMVGDGEIAAMALAKLRERIEAKTRLGNREAERKRLQRALAETDRRLRNGRSAVLDADTPAERQGLQEALRDEEARAEGIRGELARLDVDAPANLDERRILDRATVRLAELGELHARSGIAARPVLLALLGGQRFDVIPSRVDGKRTWRIVAEVSEGYLGALAGAPWSVRDASASCSPSHARRAWPWPSPRRPPSARQFSGLAPWGAGG